MTDSQKRSIIFLPWLTLPVWIARCWLVWQSIPERLALHFGLSGSPNGWQSRAQFVVESSLFLAMLLAITSALVSLSIWKRFKAVNSGIWRVLVVVQYALSLFIFTLFWRLLSANIESSGKVTHFAVPASWAMVGAIVGLLALVVISYAGRPGSERQTYGSE
jgi:uncharacterized membrane protein